MSFTPRLGRSAVLLGFLALSLAFTADSTLSWTPTQPMQTKSFCNCLAP
jgi:hypothetical protein